MKVVIYHNPRCTKSRQTLELLKKHDVEPEVVEYLKNPPSAARVKEIIDLLGVPPHAVLRKGEAEYEQLGLSDKSSKTEIAKAIAEHPILLERPIVIAGKKAVIGRPPENVLRIIE
jgi:arsenate reductase